MPTTPLDSTLKESSRTNLKGMKKIRKNSLKAMITFTTATPGEDRNTILMMKKTALRRSQLRKRTLRKTRAPNKKFACRLPWRGSGVFLAAQQFIFVNPALFIFGR